MKNKHTIIIGLVTVILLLAGPVKAAEIDLIIDDQLVKQELRIVKGRTLVPARVIADYFNGRLQWEPKKQNLKVITNDLGIDFKLGSQAAVVNSQVIPLTIAPCIIDGRVFISLRALKKIYGGYLVWKPAEKKIYYHSNQVKDIKVTTTKTGAEVVIDTNFLPDYEINLLTQPQRLVIDLQETNRAEIENLLAVNSQIIKRIRISQFTVAPAVVRIVVDLGRFSSYHLQEQGAKLALQIKAKPGIVTSSIRKQRSRSKPKQHKIVIDPGHGGEDPGAIGFSGIKEKKINLQLGKQTAKLLEQAGYQTLLTRKRDRFIPLAQRAQLANQWSADIFISIHANFNYKPRINGTATYAHWYSGEKNWALAWYVQSELVKRIGLKDNGLKAANFVVLRKTDMPAILLETAFLSNPQEERLLVNKEFQTKAVQGIVAGIKKYFANQSNR